MSNRAIVLGGTGFLGRALLGSLKGSYSVVAGSRQVDQFIDVEFRPFDILLDQDLVKKLEGFTCVINCTGQITHPLKVCAELNTSGILRLSRAARAAGVRKFVQISSSAVYGLGVNIHEELSPNPSTSYGALKLASENIVIDNFSNALVVRLSNLYSLTASSGFFAYLVRQYHSRNSEITLNNDGRMMRQYLHVLDAAKIIGELVNRNITGIVNIAGPDYLSIREIIDRFERKLNFTFERQFAGINLGKIWMSNAKLTDLINPIFERSLQSEIDEIKYNG